MANQPKNPLSWGSLLKFSTEKFKDSLEDLKEIDTTLTNISKTSDLTTGELKKLGNAAFEAAEKFAFKANDYLLSVQEMSRAGYDNAEQMAFLSTLLQSAEGICTELADSYVLAADAALGYGGDVEKLTRLLDGQYQITARNALSMGELSSAAKTAGDILSDMPRLPENQMTALFGAGILSSKESGENVARALKSILMNLQGIAGEGGFQGEIIDEEALARAEARCRSLGVELEHMENGISGLRTPAAILRDLADAYNALPDGSSEKAGILSDIGGKYGSHILSGLLSNWGTYEKMLRDYDTSAGSMMESAEKSADSLQGALNRLGNTWTDMIGNMADSGALSAGINMLNNLLSAANNLTETLGPLGSLGIGAGLFAGLKNVGVAKLH